MKPNTIAELQENILLDQSFILRGAGTKPALSSYSNGSKLIELNSIRGILEYDPGEYTFTALGGTSLQEINHVLAEHHQFLPFDPPLVEAGATLGGTVAAGLSGPGRYRFGGVRDFIIGVKYIDGKGRIIRGGGKVVKNSAGFDLPKLMVGSLGQYGALVELAFKVFPHPEAYLTLRADYPSIDTALDALIQVSTISMDLFALELYPTENGASMLIRLGGIAGSFSNRVIRLQTKVLTNPVPNHVEIVEGEAEAAIWQEAREFTWVPSGSLLVKVPLTPKRVPTLDEQLVKHNALRRYSVGANLGWVVWSESVEALDIILKEMALSGLILFGADKQTQLGKSTGEVFARRVKDALDPQQRWR